MDNNSVINADEIISKIKKLPKTAYICLIAGAAFLIAAIIALIVDVAMGVVITIVCAIFAVMFFAIVGLKVLKSKKKLKNVNFFDLKNELKGGCVSFDKQKTYFTQNYMVSNYYYAFVIKYTDIVWIYKYDKRNQNGVVIGSDLRIFLNDGKKEYTIYKDSFCEEIIKRNNDVFEGFSLENRRAYKEIVKNNKGNKKKIEENKETNNNMVSPANLEIGPSSPEPGSNPAVDLPAIGIEPDTQPKDMFDIDPLYKIPGMANDTSDTKASTTNFLAFGDVNGSIEQENNLLNQKPSMVQTAIDNNVQDSNPILEHNMVTNEIQAQPTVEPVQQSANMFTPTFQSANINNMPLAQDNTNNVNNTSQLMGNNSLTSSAKPTNQQEMPHQEIQNQSYDVNQIKNPFIN